MRYRRDDRAGARAASRWPTSSATRTSGRCGCTVTPAVLVPAAGNRAAGRARAGACGRKPRRACSTWAPARAPSRSRWRASARSGRSRPRICRADALSVARANAASHGLTRVQFAARELVRAARRAAASISSSAIRPTSARRTGAGARRARATSRARALSPGADGWRACAPSSMRAPPHLEHGGWLLLEHGATQAADVARELVVRGFRHVRSHRDLAGHERMTEAQWG